MPNAQIPCASVRPEYNNLSSQPIRQLHPLTLQLNEARQGGRSSHSPQLRQQSYRLWHSVIHSNSTTSFGSSTNQAVPTQQ